MGGERPDRAERHLCVGLLAHVDAGKTTLAEALLYRTGAVRALGRVDHRDAHLDTHALERERGITIFSKQARFPLAGGTVTLLDTPGHADFSAEMERTLQVLDAAILVVSATDGVQAHTETVWSLLRRYRVPTFLFVTKMDLPGADRAALLAALQRELAPGVTDFTAPEAAWQEAAALCDEDALERYLAGGALPDESVRDLIARRRVFPCWFGSGLRLEGVDAFLAGLARFAPRPAYPEDFGALAYQIMRDESGARLTCLKVTGGTLRVRDAVTYFPPGSGEAVTEKVSAIRLYSGARFETAQAVPAGTVCAVQGLTLTAPGLGIGAAQAGARPLLEPVMTYRVALPAGTDARTLLPRLRELEQEEPELHPVWSEATREIHVQIMGAVQREVLERLVRDRFDTDIALDAGRIAYKETITAPVEGVGHFEPLRHYAEVHLLLEPGARGAGLTFDTRCDADTLAVNWQRLILTHLAEKEHRGVLTGAPLTDVRITLLAGRAHPKHTEGGDFREATYRAVRQGLMRAESLLLEPYYAFRLAVPPEQLGRAISDLRAMSGDFSVPETTGELSVLTGRAPVACLRDYAAAVAAYTRGRGRLSCTVDGYDVCHDAAAVLAAADYDPARDTENPSGSVFCAHGAGTFVPWDRVRDYMHLDTGYGRADAAIAPRIFRRNLDLDDRELEAIMAREFGPIRRRSVAAPRSAAAAEPAAPLRPRQERLIVDGYNVIFDWEELRPLAETGDLSAARERLQDMLSNYAGYTHCELALVFDAYRVRGGQGERFDYHNIHVAFTRAGETADAYIERLADEIGKNEAVRVVTSDNLIRLTALRAGVLRTSAREFRSEVAWVSGQIEATIRRLNG